MKGRERRARSRVHPLPTSPLRLPAHLVQAVDDHHPPLQRVIRGAVPVRPAGPRRRRRAERVDKPRGKLALVVEDVRQEQVEQRPQFAQLVLERGAGQQQPARALEVVQVAREFRLTVLHALRFVDDEVLPRHLGQLGPVAHDELVRRHENVKLLPRDVARKERRPLLAPPHVVDDPGRRKPGVELGAPVDEDGVRDDDQVGTVVAFGLHEVGEQGHDLHRLAEAHLQGNEGEGEGSGVGGRVEDDARESARPSLSPPLLFAPPRPPGCR